MRIADRFRGAILQRLRQGNRTASIAPTPNAARTASNGACSGISTAGELVAGQWDLRSSRWNDLIAGQVLPFLMAWGMGGLTQTGRSLFCRFGLYGSAGILAFFGVAHLLLALAAISTRALARPLGLVLGFLAHAAATVWNCARIYTIWVLLPSIPARSITPSRGHTSADPRRAYQGSGD